MKPRVCFVSLPSYGYFNPNAYAESAGGGAKRQIYLLGQELKTEFDVAVVVGDYGQPRTETRDGVILHRAYTPNHGTKIGQFIELFRALSRAEADVYIYRGNPRKAAIIGLMATGLRSNWIYHIANDADLDEHYDSMSVGYKILFKSQIKNAAGVIAQTEFQQSKFKDRFGIKPTIIPNGYPVASERSTDPEYFLWVGRLTESQKRPHLLLECAQQMPDRSFKLIGPRSDEEYADEVVERTKTLSNVEYVGAVPPDEIHEYYKNAIALVNTSRYEGFPNTFLEAWRYGSPVVSLDVDTNRFLDSTLFDGYAGGSITSMIDTMEVLASDLEFRSEVGDELKQYFEANYSIESVGDSYKEAIKQCLQ